MKTLLSLIRFAVSVTVAIGLMTLIAAAISPPTFREFVKFGMTIPAAMGISINAASIYVLAGILKRHLKPQEDHLEKDEAID